MLDKSNQLNYKLADLKEKDYSYFKSVEDKLKSETGKEFVIIAWEKNI